MKARLVRAFWFFVNFYNFPDNLRKPVSKSVKLLPTLKTRKEFLALRKMPKYQTAEFILQGVLTADGDNLPKVGYTVTKKTGNSVVRNRIKRKLRHALAQAWSNYSQTCQTEENYHSKGAGEVVIVARKSAINDPYLQMVSKLEKGIDRIASRRKKAS